LRYSLDGAMMVPPAMIPNCLPDLKRDLRRDQRHALRDTCPEHRAALASAILESLLNWLASRPPGLLLAYAPLADEPALHSLPARARTLGWSTALPRVAVDDPLLRLHLAGDDFPALPGAFGQLEPDPAACPEVAPAAVTIAVIPALAFDPRTGIRLGRGGGYYDRLLAAPGWQAEAVGVAFPWHLLAGLPREPHDRPVDWLATPGGLVRPTAVAS
jgi:5-formyltetrahydrofolate cyclo-ligase